MTISILKTIPVGATATESPGIFMKSESAFINICDKGKVEKKQIFYSCDQLLSCLTININHN